MLKIAINLFGLQDWFEGDLASVVELVQIAERIGIDQISTGDHVAIGEEVSNYPFGQFSSPLDYPWNEPIVMLSAIAAATSRIRLWSSRHCGRLCSWRSNLRLSMSCRADAWISA